MKHIVPVCILFFFYLFPKYKNKRDNKHRKQNGIYFVRFYPCNPNPLLLIKWPPTTPCIACSLENHGQDQLMSLRSSLRRFSPCLVTWRTNLLLWQTVVQRANSYASVVLSVRVALSPRSGPRSCAGFASSWMCMVEVSCVGILKGPDWLIACRCGGALWSCACGVPWSKPDNRHVLMPCRILDRNRTTHEVVSCDMYCMCCAVCTNKMGPRRPGPYVLFQKSFEVRSSRLSFFLI